MSMLTGFLLAAFSVVFYFTSQRSAKDKSPDPKLEKAAEKVRKGKKASFITAGLFVALFLYQLYSNDFVFDLSFSEDNVERYIQYGFIFAICIFLLSLFLPPAGPIEKVFDQKLKEAGHSEKTRIKAMQAFEDFRAGKITKEELNSIIGQFKK